MRNPAFQLMLRFAGIIVLGSLALAGIFAYTDFGSAYLLPIPFLAAAYDGGLRLYTRTGRFPTSLEAWCLVFAYLAVTLILVGGALAGLLAINPGLEFPTVAPQIAAIWSGGALMTLIFSRLLISAASRRAEDAII